MTAGKGYTFKKGNSGLVSGTSKVEIRPGPGLYFGSNSSKNLEGGPKNGSLTPRGNKRLSPPRFG